ncbi:MAG: STAS domain-containing protein [Pseudomonadota bacterium]
MPLNNAVSTDGKSVTIKIDGSFDFKLHREFRDAYSQNKGASIKFVVDLSNTTYMDSSALGMLLLLREHVGGDASRVMIVNRNPDIKKIFEISNFHQLFEFKK